MLLSNIEILPGQPQNVEVEGLSDSSIKVSWGPPLSNADSITEYVVNVTMLRTFDDNTMDTTTDSQNSSQSIVTPHSVQITVKVRFNNRLNECLHLQSIFSWERRYFAVRKTLKVVLN